MDGLVVEAAMEEEDRVVEDLEVDEDSGRSQVSMVLVVSVRFPCFPVSLCTMLGIPLPFRRSYDPHVFSPVSLPP